MGKQTDVSLPGARQGSDGIMRLPAGPRPSEQAEAMARFAVLRPHLEDGVPLTRAAAEAEVPIRTVRRWLARYRRDGLVGLTRGTRADRGCRRLPDELVRAVEGMALARPPPSAATIHRRLTDLAPEKGWPLPAARTVRAIIAAIDPAMRTLAHEGPAAGARRSG